MKVTQSWTRKRTAHNTACWECYRHHRGCDGARPCKRCTDLGRWASCRDPARDERIPRKRKRSNSKEGGKSVTITNQKGVLFVADPHLFSSNEPFVTPPSLNFADSAPQPHLDRDFCCENGGEDTQRFRKDQGIFILDRPHATNSYLTRRQPTQITMYYNVPPSVEALMEETAVYQHGKATDSGFQSLSVPDDMIRLSESFFSPFGLRDSTQVCVFASPRYYRVYLYQSCSTAIHCVQAMH